MNIKLSQKDINYLNSHTSQSDIAQYLKSKSLTDSNFGISSDKQKDNLSLIEKLIRKYAISYQASHDLYFAVKKTVMDANGGKIPFVYKGLIKRYYNAWKEQSKGYWILALVNELNNNKILDSNGNVILPKFGNSGGGLSDVSLVLVGIITIGATVIIISVMNHLIKSWETLKVKDKGINAVSDLAIKYANGEIDATTYNKSLNAIVKITTSSQKSDFFKHLLWGAGGLIIVGGAGYVAYKHFVKGDSIPSILHLNNFGFGKVKNIAVNSGERIITSSANMLVDKFVGSKL